MKDFFISFAGADRQWAAWIACVLEEAGLQVIFQDWDFTPSTNFVLEMDKALRTCKRVLLVISRKFFESSFVAAEWSAAFVTDPAGEKGRILPVRVEPCEVSGLLGPVVYVDFVGLSEESAKDRLLQAALPASRRLREKPPFPGGPIPSPVFPATDK